MKKEQVKDIEEIKDISIETLQSIMGTEGSEGIDEVLYPASNLEDSLESAIAIGETNALDKLKDDIIDNPESRKKVGATGYALKGISNIYGGKLLDYDEEDGREFTNDLIFEETPLFPKQIKAGKGNPGPVNGGLAKVKAYSFMGVSGNIHIPLWHTGVWVTIGNIGISDITNLNYKIATNTVTLGRDTNGLVFSNDVVIYNRIVLEFIIKHIVNTSVKLNDFEELKELISVHDITILTSGLISTMYPRGYDVILPCNNTIKLDDNNDIKCDNVSKAKTDPLTLLVVDRSSITDEQKRFMCKKLPNTTTLEEVIAYKESIERSKDKDMEIEHYGNVLKFTLSVPNMEEYINAGERWISETIDRVSDTLNEDEDENIRNSKYLELYNRTSLNTFAHYFKKLYVSEDQYVENINDIIDTLNTYSMDNELAAKIIEEVRKYINESVVAMVGIEVYTCPTCDQLVESEEHIEPFRDIIPLNVMKILFDLSTLKLAKTRTN